MRLHIKSILADEKQRRELAVQAIQALQALAGIDTTREQAERAYDKALEERRQKAAGCSESKGGV